MEGSTFPGVRSFLELDSRGEPAAVLLEDRLSGVRCRIGRREGAGMVLCPGVLDGTGTAFLREAARAPGRWAVVDEVGFLEEGSPLYQEALWDLFDRKRVTAVLRKADLPFLERLRRREDCLVVDLDRLAQWEEESFPVR